MKELTLSEMSKVSGGVEIEGLSQNGVYTTEIKECGGRKLMYVYDKDGNIVMIADLTKYEAPAQMINPEAYEICLPCSEDDFEPGFFGF